jgi:hypothetical protein
VSNLTTSTAFIETMHTASFGDVLELRFSDVVVKAEVVFVADAPMGWVVRFDPDPALIDRARHGAAREEEDVVADLDFETPVPFEPEASDLWGDPTPTFEGPPAKPRLTNG